MTVHNIETMKSERDTAGLIEALKHPGDASVRCTAAEALEPTQQLRAPLSPVLVVSRIFGCWARRVTRRQLNSGRWAAPAGARLLRGSQVPVGVLPYRGFVDPGGAYVGA